VKLLEAMLAVAIVAVATGAWLSASGAFARFSTHQVSPVRAAADLLAEQTLRVAQDAWKYGSPGTAPSGTWQTAVPLNAPDAAPTSAPVAVTASIVSSGETADITVTVQYTPDPARPDDPGTVSLNGTLAVKAPTPGTHLVQPALIPQPSGAP
jgi:hypothetical protein